MFHCLILFAALKKKEIKCLHFGLDCRFLFNCVLVKLCFLGESRKRQALWSQAIGESTSALEIPIPACLQKLTGAGAGIIGWHRIKGTSMWRSFELESYRVIPRIDRNYLKVNLKNIQMVEMYAGKRVFQKWDWYSRRTF